MSTEATTPKPKKRDRIGVILYLLYVALLIAALVLIVRLAGIQLFWRPDPKIADALTPSTLGGRLKDELQDPFHF